MKIWCCFKIRIWIELKIGRCTPNSCTLTKRSQAEKYRDSRKISITRQKSPDSKVYGFKVPTLDSGFKTSGDTTKPGSFYFGFVHVQSSTKAFRIHRECGTISSNVKRKSKWSKKGGVFMCFNTGLRSLVQVTEKRKSQSFLSSWSSILTQVEWQFNVEAENMFVKLRATKLNLGCLLKLCWPWYN